MRDWENSSMEPGWYVSHNAMSDLGVPEHTETGPFKTKAKAMEHGSNPEGYPNGILIWRRKRDGSIVGDRGL